MNQWNPDLLNSPQNDMEPFSGRPSLKVPVRVCANTVAHRDKHTPAHLQHGNCTKEEAGKILQLISVHVNQEQSSR